MVMEEEARPPRIGPAMTLYLFSLLGAMAIHKVYDVQGWWLVPVYAVPTAALGWVIVQARRMRAARAAACGRNKTYQRRVLGLAIAYVVLLMLANWLTSRFVLDGVLAFLVALLPALPMVGMVIAIGRLILDEKDEYQRMLHVRQMLIATGFMLSVCSVWGFLEEFNQVPHVPAFWAFIVWCAGLALGTLYNESRS